MLYKITGAGHVWLQANNDVNANVEIWNFFSQYTLESSTRINTASEDITVNAFPNPFQEEVVLEIPKGQFEKATLFNLTGQQIASFSLPELSENIVLNLQHLHLALLKKLIAVQSVFYNLLLSQ